MSELYVNTFLFRDPNGYDHTTCQTTLSILEKVDNEITYYDVQMKSIYSDGIEIKTYLDVIAHSSHPLVSMKQNNMLLYFRGFSVVKNDMTTQMIRYMMMEDAELCQYTGTITPGTYRRNIIHSLIHFID
jgi:hypothetical protein